MMTNESTHTLLFKPNQDPKSQWADYYRSCTSINPELPPLTSVKLIILGETSSEIIMWSNINATFKSLS